MINLRSEGVARNIRGGCGLRLAGANRLHVKPSHSESGSQQFAGDRLGLWAGRQGACWPAALGGADLRGSIPSLPCPPPLRALRRPSYGILANLPPHPLLLPPLMAPSGGTCLVFDPRHDPALSSALPGGGGPGACLRSLDDAAAARLVGLGSAYADRLMRSGLLDRYVWRGAEPGQKVLLRGCGCGVGDFGCMGLEACGVGLRCPGACKGWRTARLWTSLTPC
mgnify:CR=1 FL=1